MADRDPVSSVAPRSSPSAGILLGCQGGVRYYCRRAKCTTVCHRNKRRAKTPSAYSGRLPPGKTQLTHPLLLPSLSYHSYHSRDTSPSVNQSSVANNSRHGPAMTAGTGRHVGSEARHSGTGLGQDRDAFHVLNPKQARENPPAGSMAVFINKYP